MYMFLINFNEYHYLLIKNDHKIKIKLKYAKCIFI